MSAFVIPVGWAYENVFASLGASEWHRCEDSHEDAGSPGGTRAWFVLGIDGVWYPAHVSDVGEYREVRLHDRAGFFAENGRDAMLIWSHLDAKIGLRSARRMLSRNATDESACRLHRVCLDVLHRVERLAGNRDIGAPRLVNV